MTDLVKCFRLRICIYVLYNEVIDLKLTYPVFCIAHQHCLAKSFMKFDHNHVYSCFLKVYFLIAAVVFRQQCIFDAFLKFLHQTFHAIMFYSVCHKKIIHSNISLIANLSNKTHVTPLELSHITVNIHYNTFQINAVYKGHNVFYSRTENLKLNKWTLRRCTWEENFWC